MGLSSHFEERLHTTLRRGLLGLVLLLATTCGSKQDSSATTKPEGGETNSETWQAPKDGVTPDGNFDVVEIAESKDTHQDPSFAISLNARGGLIDDGAWLFYECSSKQLGSTLSDAVCGGLAIKDLSFSVVTSETSLQLAGDANSTEAKLEGVITPGSPVKFGRVNSGSNSPNGGVVVKLPIINEQNVTAVVARKDGKASSSASVKVSPANHNTNGSPRELTSEEQQSLLRVLNLPQIKEPSRFNNANLEKGISSLAASEVELASMDSADVEVTPASPPPPSTAPGGSTGQSPINFDLNVQGTATCVYPGPAKPICQQAAEAVFAAKKNVELKKEEIEVAKANLATQKEFISELRRNLGRAKSLATSINSQFITECGSSKYLEFEECQEFKETRKEDCYSGYSFQERIPHGDPYWVTKDQKCRPWKSLSHVRIDCPNNTPRGASRYGRRDETVELHSVKTGRTKRDYSHEQNMCLDTTGKSLRYPQINYGYWALELLENGAPCGKSIGKITKLVMNPGSPKAQCDVVTQTAKDFGFLDATALKLGDGYCVDGPKTCYKYTQQCAKRVVEGSLKQSFSGASWCKSILKNDYLGCLEWHPIKASVGVMVVLGEFAYTENAKVNCTNPYHWASREEICNSASGFLVQSLKDVNELIAKVEPQAQSEKKKYDDMTAELKKLEADLKSAEEELNAAYRAEEECLGFNEQVNATATVCEPCRVCNPNEVIGTESCESGYPDYHKGTRTKKCNSKGSGFEEGPCIVCKPSASETISCTSSFGHGEGTQVKTCNADGTNFELGPCQICTPNESFGCETCPRGTLLSEGFRTKTCNSNGTTYDYGPCLFCKPNESAGTETCTKDNLSNGQKGSRTKTCNADGTDFEKGPCIICTPSTSETLSCTTWGGLKGTQSKTCNADGTDFELGPCQICTPNESAGTQACSMSGDWFSKSGSQTKTCNSVGTGFDLGPCQICTPNESVESGPCSVTNGTGTKTKTCSSDGTGFNTEEVCNATSCNSGFTLSGGQCVQQVCTPNEISSQSCSVANGSGSQSRSCNSSGSAWGSFGACTATSCNSGFTLSGGQCVQQQVCTPNAISSQSCSVANGGGRQSRSCNSSGSAWGDWGACTLFGCNIGFIASGGTGLLECVPQQVCTPGVTICMAVCSVPNGLGTQVGYCSSGSTICGNFGACRTYICNSGFVKWNGQCVPQ